VAEFYDHTTVAMVIDPNGNVAIHQARSDGYALSVVGGISMDTLTLGTPLAISSGGTGTATGAPPNQVFAGPSLGGAGAPFFRALVNADLPSIISVSNVSANGAGLYSLNSSNLVGNVANATVALVVSQASQPNITSVGLLSNLAVSNSVTTANVVSSLANIGTLTVISISNLATLTTNLVATTSNVDLLNVITVSNLSSLTTNLVATTANVGTLNVISVSNLSSLTTNLVASIANVGTLNVVTVSNLSSLTTNLIATTANVKTLNVISISNLNSLQVSNALQTTNLFASGNVVIGPTPTAVLANLHVEQGSIFVGNSGFFGANYTSVGSPNLLVFDNTSNSTVIPNKVVLFSNGAGNTSIGMGVFGVGPSSGSVAYYTKDAHYFYAGFTTGPYCVGGFTSSSTFTVGSTPSAVNAKFWVTGGAPTSNIMARIDASNIALATSGAGLVGFGTTAPTANLHVIGNVYASNALQTTNVFATTANVGTLNVISISNLSTLSVGLYFGNASGLSNITGSNVTGNVAQATLALVVSQAAQPNITSVGILSNLVVGNSLTTTNVYLTGTMNLQGTANISNIITQNVTAFGTSLVVTGVTVNGNVYVSNTSTAANGFLATGSFGGGFPDGIVMDYVQGTVGNGRLSVGTNDALTFYTGGLGTTPTAYFDPNLCVGLGTVTPSSNLQVVGNIYASNSLTTTNAYLSGTLNVQGTSNISVANIANIYTTNIVGFVGSQWSGASGSTIYYINPVGIGTSISGSNLTVSGNVYVSNAIQTGNLILGGLTSGGFLQAQGTSNVTSVSTIPIGSGGTNQTSYGTTGGVLYYDGTRFQTASGITVSTPTTLNVTTANITTVQTNSFIPAASGIFMNLTATYTLNSTSNWLGNIAGTITSNLYTLFAPLPGIAGWNAYGSSSLVNAPTVNGGIKFNQPGPYIITTVISADSGIKTIALSSNLGNTVDTHSNVTNVWQYCYRFPFGDVNPWPVTIPVNVTNTSQYYYIDYETNNQTDNIHQTAYTNTTSQAYTGSYVIIRPV
jgi:hypothetical protein